MEYKAKSMKATFTNAAEPQPGNHPDFKSSDGVAVWVNKDKNGEEYLSVQILGKNGIKVNCFKYQPKQL